MDSVDQTVKQYLSCMRVSVKIFSLSQNIR